MNTAASPVSGSVTGRRLTMSRPTGTSYWIDTPRSPRRARPSHSAYCTTSGRFRPSDSRRRAAASGLPSVPMIRSAGSPGRMRMTRKTSTETKKRVATSAATLRRTYRRTSALSSATGCGSRTVASTPSTSSLIARCSTAFSPSAGSTCETYSMNVRFGPTTSTPRRAMVSRCS